MHILGQPRNPTSPDSFHQAKGDAHVHKHLICRLGFGQAGQAHQLSHASEIHLRQALEGIVLLPG